MQATSLPAVCMSAGCTAQLCRPVHMQAGAMLSCSASSMEADWLCCLPALQSWGDALPCTQ